MHIVAYYGCGYESTDGELAPQHAVVERLEAGRQQVIVLPAKPGGEIRNLMDVPYSQVPRVGCWTEWPADKEEHPSPRQVVTVTRGGQYVIFGNRDDATREVKAGESGHLDSGSGVQSGGFVRVQLFGRVETLWIPSDALQEAVTPAPCEQRGDE